MGHLQVQRPNAYFPNIMKPIGRNITPPTQRNVGEVGGEFVLVFLVEALARTRSAWYLTVRMWLTTR